MAYYLRFDMPVSVNQMYRRTRYSTSLTNEAAAWKHYASVMAYQQWQLTEPLKGDIKVTYWFHGSKMDFDNPLKLLNDSCNGIIWEDDKQIIEAHIYIVNRKDKDKHVVMEVSEL